MKLKKMLTVREAARKIPKDIDMIKTKWWHYPGVFASQKEMEHLEGV